ncbi:hypothetical protein D7X33_26780 [Butyricicoccus sp. 1XD8-22]|nr:hypothetical protein D7X33_26780 [Butyricicoccus sp. 1XD8-22]
MEYPISTIDCIVSICSCIDKKNYRAWPIYRIVSFSLGIICIATALIGPIAMFSYTNFTAHMVGHLLLGMLGP